MSTKEQLAAENAKLREENEALRGFLAAVSGAHPALPADCNKMHRYYTTSSDRLMVAAVYAEGAIRDAGKPQPFAALVRDAAVQLGKQCAKPLSYEPEAASDETPAAVSA